MKSEHARRVFDFQEARMVPLSAVLERYGILGDLKRIGKQYFGCCPIHRGSNRKQFVCDLEKNVWKCFGDCDRGGSTIELVSEIEGVEIRAAAELIASWFAIGTSSRNVEHRKEKKAMSGNDRPTHRLCVVEGEGEKAFWHRVGAGWPTKNPKVLTITLPPGIAVSGRLQLVEEGPEEEPEDNKGKSTKKR